MLLLMDLFAPLAGIQSNKSPKIQHLVHWGGWYTFFVSGSGN
jgi:hypothetical protein